MTDFELGSRAVNYYYTSATVLGFLSTNDTAIFTTRAFATTVGFNIDTAAKHLHTLRDIGWVEAVAGSRKRPYAWRSLIRVTYRCK